MTVPQFTPVASWKIPYDQLIREKLCLVYAEVSSIIVLFSCSLVAHSLQPLWTTTLQGSLSFTISWSLLKLISLELVMPSNNLVLCFALLSLTSIFPNIRVFSN